MSRIEIKFQQSLWTLGLAAALATPSALLAGGGSTPSGSPSGVAEQEIIKRLQRIEQAKQAEIDGDMFARDGDFEKAYAKYNEAVAGIPNAPNASLDRNRIVGKYLQMTIAHAQDLAVKRGRQSEAKAILNAALADDIAPHNTKIKTELARLDDPDYVNPANSAKHFENTEKVMNSLKMGMGYYDLGDFVKAEEEFNKVLAVDPHNISARRLLEKTEHSIIAYHKASRDHTRSRMMREVDGLWETAVPGTAIVPINTPPPSDSASNKNSATVFKLKNIKLPKVTFEDTSVEDAFDYLRGRSKELDPTPEKDGVNFVLAAGLTGTVTINLTNVPLIEAIAQICQQAKLEYRVEAFSVNVNTIGGGGGVMETRVFRVPPSFMTQGATDDAGADAGAGDPFGGAGTETGPKLKKRPDAKTVLVSFGIDFTAPGADAKYLPGSGRLIVKNNALQLDAIQGIIDEMGGDVPKQVQVTAKFVEVSQRNTDELGFDWLMGAFNVGSSGIFGSGGTTGNTGNLRAADYPFLSPTSGASPTPVAQNPITRALRSGTGAITQNAIDGLLSRTVTAGDISSMTPATFAIAGVFTDPQFQTLMRAMSQKKGVDLLTAPTVVAKSGQRAKIEVIREFPYPTDFDPPQIPQNFGGSSNFSGGGFGGNTGGLGGVTGGLGGGSVNSFPVTPTTPTAFETKNTGVSMEIDPLLGEDGITVELTLAPEVVEFEGFINYGSPINTGAINAAGVPTTVILTENRIEQPVFATRRLSTSVTIWDGQTVGIGGLIREDVQNVEDKVPLFGDIPFVGRLFKSKAEEHFKKNLMIYVSAKVIDPSGQSPRNSGPADADISLDSGAQPDLVQPGL